MRAVGLHPSAFLLLGLLSVVVVSLPAAADSIQLSVTGVGYLGGTSDGLSVQSGNSSRCTPRRPTGQPGSTQALWGNP